jgi:hypothetical protein
VSADSHAPSAVFTNRLGRDTIRSTLVAQLHPTTRARLRLVPVLMQPAAIRRYVASVGLQWAPLKWGMTKVLAHELLPDCFEWLLLLDADVMFAGDVRELWHLRHAFNATQLLGGYQEYTYNSASLAKLGNNQHGESRPSHAQSRCFLHILFSTLVLEPRGGGRRPTLLRRTRALTGSAVGVHHISAGHARLQLGRTADEPAANEGSGPGALTAAASQPSSVPGVD